MNKSRVIRWLLFFAAFGVVLFVGFHLLRFGCWGQQNMMASGRMGGMPMQGFHHGGMQNGLGRGQFGGPGGMRHFRGGHGIFGIGSIVIALIVAAIGWFLRKNAKGSMWKKWGGWVLIIIGTLMLISRVVPLVLFIIIGVVIWKLVARKKKGSPAENLAADYSLDSIAPISSKTGNMLDEWERNVSKEEK